LEFSDSYESKTHIPTKSSWENQEIFNGEADIWAGFSGYINIRID
jgi:hypothetical protein